jgi:chromosome segregation ATPase
MKEFLFMSARDEYIQKMKAKLDELNAEISRLEAKAQGAKADLRLRYGDEIRKLEARREEAEARLAEFRQAGENAWQDLKIGIQSAWDILEESIKSAKERF